MISSKESFINSDVVEYNLERRKTLYMFFQIINIFLMIIVSFIYCVSFYDTL